MSSAVRQWLGHEKPKQYCTFIGSRSLLQHTIDRVDRLVPPERRVIVAAEEHAAEVERQLEGRVRGHVVLQPANRDTAAGLFLALAHVRARDPRALVAVFPSDHFVYPEEIFVREMRRVVGVARALPDRIVLVGAQPDAPDADYGWIELEHGTSGQLAAGARLVTAFVEKPTLFRAREAMRKGGVWNTLILVATLEALLSAGRKALPEIAARFDLVADAMGTARERATLATLYRTMPSRNLSSALLERIPERLAVVVMNGVLWSDWGRPERIIASTSRLRRRPDFPATCLWDPGGIACGARARAEEESCET